MGKIALTVIGWILRKFGLLLLLVAGYLLAPSVKDFWDVIVEFDPIAVAEKIERKVKESIPRKDTSKEEIARKIQGLRNALEQKKRNRIELGEETCFLPTCSTVKNAKLYAVDLEFEIIERALIYAEALRNGKLACADLDGISVQLADLRSLASGLSQAKSAWMPQSAAHSALLGKMLDLEKTQKASVEACNAYQRLADAFDANLNTVRQRLDTKHGKFLTDLGELKASRSKLLQGVLPPALATLAGIIFLPIGIKLAAYYGVAPMASRRFGVRLLPESSGELMVASPPQALQRIDLEKGWELLIAPSLLRSSPDAAVKRTKTVLDWSMPLSSIASGLYLLTCIRTEGTGTVTISAGEEDRNEITVLELPANSALVLQPRCLVGVIQRIDRPLKITRPWRLGNLGSWLTLQLRYVVFHGPAKLIVKGNRGVEVDAAQAGTSINQAATLGFSANLGYGVARSGPFYGYLSGKTELFNDCFSSGPGYYVHEVHPRPPKTTLLPGRGIEGILGSILKAFGL